MIECQQLCKNYQGYKAVDSLTLSIPESCVYAFLGPNGAGKTSSIRMFTGILMADGGDLRVFGKHYAKSRKEILSQIGYIPDRPYLYEKLTAVELLEFHAGLHRLNPSKAKKRSLELLEQFDLSEKAFTLIEKFSHGMKQKLVIACALLHQPQLLIVDEPMVGLDPRATKQIKQLMRGFADSGGTVFMSTHTLAVAEEICDRVGIIHRGKLIADDSLVAIKNRLECDDAGLEEVFLTLTQETNADAK